MIQRFQGTRFYSSDQLLNAYFAWIATQPLMDKVTMDKNVPIPLSRREAWWHYVDIRDGLPLGMAKDHATLSYNGFISKYGQ